MRTSPTSLSPRQSFRRWAPVSPARSLLRDCVAIALRLRCVGYDWRERLGALRAPTLVLHGADDVLSVCETHRTESVLNDARVFVLPHAGHSPFREAPVSYFSAIEEFLGGPPPDH